jgi:phosphoribosyl-AMP cyclohydrolase
MKLSVDFTKNNGLVPTIIQDDKSGEVYMLGYMNEEVLQKTVETKWVFFYSRSRQKLWMKGEESGNKLKVKKIVKVELIGSNVCHTGNRSCFFTKLEENL